MRTYAPASTEAVLAGLLDEPSIARGVVHHAAMPGTEAEFGDHPAWLDPRIRAGLASRGIERLYTHQADGARGGPCGRGRRRRHADRVGQDAVLHAPGPPGDRRRPGGPSPVPLPHQGARPGPGRGVRRALASLGPDVSAATYDGDTPAPIRSAIRDAGQVVVTQPGHAPLGDPAPPHEVVPAVRAAPGHRHRRAAHLPRRLRQPRRERPPAAAPAVRALRQQRRSSCAARRRSAIRRSSRRR